MSADESARVTCPPCQGKGRFTWPDWTPDKHGPYACGRCYGQGTVKA